MHYFIMYINHKAQDVHSWLASYSSMDYVAIYSIRTYMPKSNLPCIVTKIHTLTAVL